MKYVRQCVTAAVLISAAGVWAAPKGGGPACYVKKATWYETVIASRDALTRSQAAAVSKAAGAAPKSFEPVRVTMGRNGSRKIKVRVAGVKRLYLGGCSTGRGETYFENARLIDRDGRPVVVEPAAAPAAALTGRKSAKASKSSNKLSIRLIDTELVLELGGRYEHLEATIRANRTDGSNKASLWVTAGAWLDAQKQALAARDAIWAAVARDFARSPDRAEQTVERTTGRIWRADWKAGDYAEIARRYAAACSSSVKGRASKLAKGVSAASDLMKVRELFYLGRRIEELKALLAEVNPKAMRLAIADLSDTFPKEYAKGPEYLRRLDALEQDLPKTIAALSKGDEAGVKQAEAVLAFQRDALLSNPLLDFDKILLVRRGANNLGLVNNWLSNSSLRKNGYDNDIAVLSSFRGEAELTTLYRPEGGRFVGDVDLHFDADRMLFSMPGQRTWQVWETRADGSGLKTLTPTDQKDVDSYDGCYLPDGRVVFTSTANMQGVPCIGGGGHVANLALLEPGTKKVRMLAFEQDHDWCPVVMNDGRVMYQRWEYTDTPHYFTRLIFTMNPDGTNQRSHYGSNSYWPNAVFFARPVPGDATKFVGIIGGHHDVRRMGELVVFDAGVGNVEADGAVQRIPGYGRKVEPIIKDGLVGRSWPHFLHPYPLSDKYVLVSRRISRSRSEWGIYLVDVFDNMLLLASRPGYALLEPIPFRKTPRPPIIPDKVDLDRTDALVYLMDVHAGGGLKGIPRGKVKKLRVFTYTFGYRGMGGHNCFGVESGWDAKRILGTVPVEADGSAFFRVPANTPISLQPLDEDGAALQLMRSWLVAMPGETLACVGCHESQNDATSSYESLATARAASQIEPWRGPARGMGFLREVQPVLDKYCAGCHDGTKAHLPNYAETKGTWRGYARSYHDLARYIRRPGPESDYHMLQPMEYHVSTSPLVQKLRKGHHNVKLDAEAWDRLITWMDMNVPYHATWTESRGGRMGGVAQRFRDLQKLYAGIDTDPEAMPPMPTERPKPIVPAPEPARRIAAPAVAGWPFGADEARKRQADAVRQVAMLSARSGAPRAVRGPRGTTPAGRAKADTPITRTFELGTTPIKYHHITRKPIEPKAVSLELTLIPAGRFVMGDAAGEPDERSLRKVRIDKPFWIGTFEVTNAQYSLFDADHDSRFIDMELKDQDKPGYPVNQADQPVVRISWQEARAFCGWLSGKLGRRLTLPTEAQWEWACRAGSSTPMWYGRADADFAAFANLSDVNVKKFALERFRPRIAAKPVPEHAWIPKIEAVDDKHQVSAPVGSYRPNAWGLHDMHGNVAEWTLSAYGQGDGDDGKKVVRGGSWRARPYRARSSYRLPYEAYQKVFNVGFRVLMEAD